MIRFTSVCMAVTLSLAAVAGAQSRVPDAGLVAESAERWEDAADVYRQALDVDPGRADLWERLADVEARRGNGSGAVAARQHASRLAPGDAAMHARLSQAYAVVNQPLAALEAIEAAVLLAPASQDYLRARATLATWAADYKRAGDSYERLGARLPLEGDLLLSYARVSAWAGDTDEAVARYAQYLAARPEAGAVWIELARAESWRGNYDAAIRALDRHATTIGISDDYERELSSVLTAAGRPRRAEAVVDRLLTRMPDSYELNLTRAIALAMQQRRKEAFDALGTVRRIAPDRRETQSAERVLRTLLASAVEPQLSVYQDSDRLRSLRIAPRATLSLTSGTQLSGGYDRTRLRARAGSGLEQLGGATTATSHRTWFAAAQKVGPLTVRAGGGYAGAEEDNLVTSLAGVQVQAGDRLRFSVEREFGYFTISPRATGLGIRQTSHRAQADWSPTLRDHIGFDALYQELSDGNRRWEIAVTPRHSVARTQRFNLDLGVSAYRLETDRDLDNGYYDPRRYEEYTAVFYPYFKFRENVGLSLSAGVGVHQDLATPGFRPGGTIGGEATFGIYEPWVVKLSGSASIHRRVETGGYQGVGGSISLIRRF